MTGLTYPQRLRKRFCWKSDEFGTLRDFTRVFSDGEILAGLGEQLAQPLRSDLPDVLLGTEAHGWLVGPLVACELGVGFVQVYKNVRGYDLAGGLISRTTRPDYMGRSISLSVRRDSLHSFHRAAIVDDWIETGAQATAVGEIANALGVELVGTSVIVDGCQSGTRQKLLVHGLLRAEELEAQ